MKRVAVSAGADEQRNGSGAKFKNAGPRVGTTLSSGAVRALKTQCNDMFHSFLASRCDPSERDRRARANAKTRSARTEITSLVARVAC
jgi:hypothetical protein